MSETIRGCHSISGQVVPQINRNRCEGKKTCVEQCPFNVLAMGKLSNQDKQQLSLIGRVKAFAHGYRQAMVVNPEACKACHRCVEVCPEGAIQLISL